MKRYERDYKDIFAIQDEITIEVLRAIGAILTEGEKVHSYKKFSNLEAYEKYAEALANVHAGNIESYAKARRLIKEAMAIESDMPQINNLLAIINVMDVWFYGVNH